MAEPRWLADEMLGRLARYLRFLGHDTEYAVGVEDDAVLARAVAEHRRLLTRDRALARRLPESVLLTTTDLPRQLRAVRAAAPDAGYSVAFRRCTLCKGRRDGWSPRDGGERPRGVPQDLVDAGAAIYACAACGHVYWEGSHTARVRADVTRWLEGGA